MAVRRCSHALHSPLLQALTPRCAASVEERKGTDDHDMPVPTQRSPTLQRAPDAEKHERRCGIVRQKDSTDNADGIV